MRKGNNPNRNLKGKINTYSHRIIVPVYIPNQEGYYKDAFKILRICIDSLLSTTSSESAITIVNNGCCIEVLNYLNNLFENNKIQDLIHTQKIGKLNSIIKALRGSSEPLITITDADVKFLPNWLNETVKVYKSFPKAGVVGIVPQNKLFEYLGYNVIYDNLFNKKIKFTKVKNPDALKEFYKSIDRDGDYNKDYLKLNLSIEGENKTRAVVGSGHFVATYKRELFDNELKYSEYLLGGNSEGKYLDIPCVKKGLWRLTTDENYAYHMGNTYENWMEKQKSVTFSEVNFAFLENHTISLKDKLLYYNISTRFMRVFYKKFKNNFYKRWKLPREMYSTY